MPKNIKNPVYTMHEIKSQLDANDFTAIANLASLDSISTGIQNNINTSITNELTKGNKATKLGLGVVVGTVDGLVYLQIEWDGSHVAEYMIGTS